ncbi:acid protease [Laetiporus sulphureus 93-53]|uniref:Acid protease n=1 Tax=Laetiporus sulphureus 93-53 TaxID=1314785 RepID=A0A165FN62_9APHY|nr:acid protease [Laetiporus sulphureus 93-53]KZT09219.1 acid protease [Laetiporus sulphureus 93-53]
MKQLSIPLFLSFVLLSTELGAAIHLDVQSRSLRHLNKRGTLTGSSSLTDSSNIGYYVNLTLGGAEFKVQIDTGSSDLYVAGTVPDSNDTGKTSGVTYAVGAVEGPIKTAKMDFLGYTVDDQAFLNIEANSDNETAGTGLIGLGPHTGSQIQSTLGNGTGDPPLDRIFQQNTSTPNYITVLLGRANDKFDEAPGNLTVGEVLPGYDNITSQPRLKVSVLQSSESGGQHWQTLLDADGVIGPDGNVVDVTTVVSSTSNDKQLTVVFDTGYSLPQVPSAVARAFYENVPDAKLVDVPDLDGEIWQVPCDYEINVTFKFGGISFPINPLDTSMDLNGTDGTGDKTCYGSFQPMQAAQSDLYDIIFGMAFLRNVYVLIDFGDFVDNTTSRADPYIQLLSLSNDSAQLHADFVAIRGDANWNPSSSVSSWVKHHVALAIGLGVAAGILVLGGALFAFQSYRRRRLARTPAGFMNFQSSYKPLTDPAPQEAHDLHLMGGSHQQQSYANPWDARY